MDFWLHQPAGYRRVGFNHLHGLFHGLGEKYRLTAFNIDIRTSDQQSTRLKQSDLIVNVWLNRLLHERLTGAPRWSG